MRILHVSSSTTFGGGERHLVDLCRGLQERGLEVFAALRPTNEWQHRLSFLPADHIMHVSIRNSFGVLSSLRVAEFIKQNDIDIVHAHVARDYIPVSIACLAARPAKFVLTRHVLFPLKPFNRFALKNLAKAIGVSDTVGEGLRKVFPPSKVAVIRNGLDVDHRSEVETSKLRNEFRSFHNIPEDVIAIGALGALKELKGQRDFVLAANELTKTHPNCFFVIVGKDSTADRSFRRELRRMVKIFGLEGQFLWLDWLDDTDAFFAGIDIFVSPSHTESFGLSLLEAMAHGKPVVATETEGSKMLLGKDAELARINDPVDLANGIARFLDDEAARAEAGEGNRLTAGKNYPLKNMIDATEELYRSILGK